MTFSLVTGVLHGDPEKRTSKSGTDFVIATVRTKAADNRAEYWRVTAFAQEARDAIMSLSAGDALSVQGSSRADLWTPEDGREPRVNLNIVADAVLALRRQKKPKERPQRDPRKPNRTGQNYKLSRSPYAPADRDLDDAVGF